MFLQPTKDHLRMNEFRQHKYSVLETWETNPMGLRLMLSKIEAEVKPSNVMDQLFVCCTAVTASWSLKYRWPMSESLAG